MTLMINFLSLISLFFGIYIGYKFAFLIYQYIKIRIPLNKERYQSKFFTFLAIDEMVNEKYDHGLLKLTPEVSKVRNKYSEKELNELYDFIDKMEELGITFIYLKPKNEEYLIYQAGSFRKGAMIKGYIQVEEYK